ncbi:type VI secretion system baseplate subunit TssG [Caballeronia sp. LZ065]|uniref:type VI secretion system baseplate subunit TssG n=1 Tax=Caballeronia sp. LZ065 TaxID=3038571 RepID=UPI0028584B4F|nr:type VI secretion system baseplate subunit TssG [Caballeronia sp. LZ065]MDR5784951.1 type VI secretion system baseplate subunit TssG [Caballeronia sp. LZ065]
METPDRLPADSLTQAVYGRTEEAPSVSPPAPPPREERLDRLLEQAAGAPYEYDLFELMRWIDACAVSPVRLGRASHPRDEPVRFGQRPSLAFAPAPLAEVRRDQREGSHTRAQVSVYGFGLFGPNGPMPLHLTEYAYERARNHGDTSLAGFADLFHHRLIALVYRAWANAQPCASLDRAADARFDDYIASLIHLGQPSLKGRGAVADHARYYMAGHLVRQTRNPEGLCRILADYFGVKTRVNEYTPGWIAIEPARQSALPLRLGANASGAGAMLGRAVRDAQHGFEIVIGPLPMERFRQFLPDTEAAMQLADWVRFYAGDELEWNVRVLLARADVRGASVGMQQRLGWDTWVGERLSPTDAGDLVYGPGIVAHHARQRRAEQTRNESPVTCHD